MSYEQLQNENLMLYKALANNQEKLDRIKTSVDNIIPEQITFKEIYYIKKYILEIIEGINKKE